jgi:hypothetical protein
MNDLLESNRLDGAVNFLSRAAEHALSRERLKKNGPLISFTKSPQFDKLPSYPYPEAPWLHPAFRPQPV